jgi:hypothetical protein
MPGTDILRQIGSVRAPLASPRAAFCQGRTAFPVQYVGTPRLAAFEEAIEESSSQNLALRNPRILFVEPGQFWGAY